MAGKSGRRSIKSAFEAIARPTDGDNPDRILGVWLDFLPQPAYMHVDRPGIAYEFPPPNLLQDRFTPEGLVVMPGEKDEQVKFFRLEGERLTVQASLLPDQADPDLGTIRTTGYFSLYQPAYRLVSQ
jgi:hypothetical protein